MAANLGLTVSKIAWTDVAARKQTIRNEHIKKHLTDSVDSSLIAQITDIENVDSLTALIEKGEFSAEEVVRAYIVNACEAQTKTNCLTEICFDDSITQAKTLDKFQQETGKLFGPLHGVPISLKDQFNVRGLDSTLGYVGRAFAPADSDAAIVETLKSLGAIIIAKTNLPQSIMWCETENPLWGLTTHPKNPNFTPGGSSGGEGALLSMHGSLVGWGTDIGGSIRIPSHCNGLWGLKPSSGRMPYQGVAVSTEGQQHVPSAIGPMARSLRSLSMVTQAVIETKLWTTDSQLPLMPWQGSVFKDFSQRPLVIGVMPDDGVVRVHPPVERVFNDTVAKLRQAGHEIVQWPTSLNAYCVAIMDEYYTADGGEDIRRAVQEGGEPFIPHVQALIDRAPPISVYEYWQINKRKVAAQQAYHMMWNSMRSASGRPVDVLLVPTMPHTALPHRGCRWVGYTKLFNFLDYTALSFPAGEVCKELDGDLPSDYKPRNSHDAWNWERYDRGEMDGHSIGLQIVGRKFEEEKVLGVAEQFESLLAN
ncbi:hypothetical protein MBLNU13_g02179t1 [Cladosporium sp. NU13]